LGEELARHFLWGQRLCLAPLVVILCALLLSVLYCFLFLSWSYTVAIKELFSLNINYFLSYNTTSIRNFSILILKLTYPFVPSIVFLSNSNWFICYSNFEALYKELSWHFVEFFTAGDLIPETTLLSNPDASLGLKELFRNHDMSEKVLRAHFSEALAIVEATTCSDVACMIPLAGGMIQKSSYWVTMPMDEVLLKVVKKYGDRILLKESDKKPKSSKKKGKKHSLINRISKENHFEKFDEWQGTPPWDPLEGGNGYPKFLCDVMVSVLITKIWCSLSSYIMFSHRIFRNFVNSIICVARKKWGFLVIRSCIPLFWTSFLWIFYAPFFIHKKRVLFYCRMNVHKIKMWAWICEEFTQVEGLAKHLRCVGIDAAIPYSKKPEPRL